MHLYHSCLIACIISVWYPNANTMKAPHMFKDIGGLDFKVCVQIQNLK